MTCIEIKVVLARHIHTVQEKLVARTATTAAEARCASMHAMLVGSFTFVLASTGVIAQLHLKQSKLIGESIAHSDCNLTQTNELQLTTAVPPSIPAMQPSCYALHVQDHSKLTSRC